MLLSDFLANNLNISAKRYRYVPESVENPEDASVNYGRNLFSLDLAEYSDVTPNSFSNSDPDIAQGPFGFPSPSLLFCALARALATKFCSSWWVRVCEVVRSILCIAPKGALYIFFVPVPSYL
jgi:hypothetical protein